MSLSQNQIKNAQVMIDRDPEKALGRYGIPPRYLKAVLTADRAEAFDALSLLFYGPGGTGKTHMICGILINELYDRGLAHTASGFSAKFITVANLLLEARSIFNDRRVTEIDTVQYYSSIDLLCLDDLGAEKLSESGTQFLYLVLNARYNNMKRTLISTNITGTELDTIIGARLASRIIGMTKSILMQGKDKRRA